jgi:hypothetical protein
MDMLYLTCKISGKFLIQTKEVGMLNFDAGSFAGLAESKIGSELWEFLNDRENIIRMETATLLKRPALEAIQSQLVERFGQEIHEDRYKQMIGRMARQVMENAGYSLDQNGVRISSKILFTSASRYKK